jgi:hypothetical protein
MLGIGVEILAHMAKAPVCMKMPTIKGDDATGFLTPMLQGMQSEGGEHIRLFRPIYAENGAFFL